MKAVWDGAVDQKAVELVLNVEEIEKMEKRPSALVVLVNHYLTNELVHRRKSRTPSNDISSEYLGVLVRIDLQSSF